MRLSETRLKQKVLAFLKAEYPRAWVYKAADRWTSGIPDILLCVDGRFMAIELKVGNNQPTRIQKYVLAKIRASGGMATVCRSVEEARNFMKGGDSDGQNRR
ncbi:MAG: VRR-NUC domain-containing protein [Elusimicrobiales bacterium]